MNGNGNHAIVKGGNIPAEIQRAVSVAQEAILTQSTPANVVKHRPGKGGSTFSYVEHAWVTEQLNLAFGWAWTWEITEWRLFPNDEEPRECMVVGKLTVQTERGPIVKMQFGSSDVKRGKQGVVLSIGDDLKAASSDGLKKAASLLGLALDLYSSDISRYEEPYRCSECDAEVPDVAAQIVARATQGLVLCKPHYIEWQASQKAEQPA